MTDTKSSQHGYAMAQNRQSGGVCFAHYARMLLEEADRLAREATQHNDRSAAELASGLYAKVDQMRADGPPCLPDENHCGDCPLLNAGQGPVLRTKIEAEKPGRCAAGKPRAWR